MDIAYLQIECEHSFSKMLASQQSNKTALDVTLEYFESKLETALTTLYTSEIYEVYLLHSDVTIAHPILGHSYEYSSILEYEVSPSGIKKKLIEDWFNSGSKNKKSSPSILVIAALESQREVELFEKLIPSIDELMGNVSVIFFREDKQWSMSQYDKTAEKFEGIVSGDTSYLTPISNLQIENLNRTIKFLGLSQQKSPFFMDYLVGLGGTPSSSSGAYEDDHGDDMDLDDDGKMNKKRGIKERETMKLIWNIERANFEFSDPSEIENWEKKPSLNFEFSPGESDDGGESVFADPEAASKYFALNESNSHFGFTRDGNNLIVSAWVRVDEEVVEDLNEESLDEWANGNGGWASCSIDLGEEVEAFITEDDGGDWRIEKV